ELADPHLDTPSRPLADRLRRRDEDVAVDLGRIGVRSRDAAVPVHLVDQYFHDPADVAPDTPRADRLLGFHEARAALFAELVREGAGKLVRGRAVDRRVGETADAVEFRLP